MGIIDEGEDETFLDNYNWGEQIGIGTFSVVHQVSNKHTSEVFAAKRVARRDKGLRDGDVVRVDAKAGVLDCLASDFDTRAPVTVDLSANEVGLGREMFAAFRHNCGLASDGGATVV